MSKNLYTQVNCSWPYIGHRKWVQDRDRDKAGRASFESGGKPQLHADTNTVVLTAMLLVGLGLKLLLIHLGGRYNKRRQYFEPLAQEVKAYSADIGGTTREACLDEMVLASQEVPDYVNSIVLALLDPLSNSYSYDVALHDYGRKQIVTVLSLLLTRSVYYFTAYHVFVYCARENFSCLSDFLQRRFNSSALGNVSTMLILSMELCQLVLLYNRTALEMHVTCGLSFQFWLILLFFISLCLTMCSTTSLVSIGILLYVCNAVVFFWMSLNLTYVFSSDGNLRQFTAWKLSSYETQKEHVLEVSDIFLYDSNLICLILAAPILHTTARLNQTEYMVFQSLAKRFKRKRVFIRAFFLSVAFNLCHKTVMRALFELRTKTGCDELFAGLKCHYCLLSDGLGNHLALKILYLSVTFYFSCWLGGFRVIAMSYTATKSRFTRSFVEFCLIGQRWVDMNRWRRQNGLILFRDYKTIDLQLYIYKVFTMAFTGCVLHYCLDYVSLDPSAFSIQSINYVVLDMRFLICLNSTIIGLVFRRITKRGIFGILILSLLLYTYQLFWGDRLSTATLQYKLMTPIYKTHAAWLRRKCSTVVRLRPVINVGKRTSDHEMIHMLNTDAFYPSLLLLTWVLAAIANCLSVKHLAVLKTPYYGIGESVSILLTRTLHSLLFQRLKRIANATEASLRLVQWRFRQRSLEDGEAESSDGVGGKPTQLRGFVASELKDSDQASVDMSVSMTLDLEKIDQKLRPQHGLAPSSMKSCQSGLSSKAVADPDDDLLILTNDLASARHAVEENALVLSCLSEASALQREMDTTHRRRKVTEENFLS